MTNSTDLHSHITWWTSRRKYKKRKNKKQNPYTCSLFLCFIPSHKTTYILRTKILKKEISNSLQILPERMKGSSLPEMDFFMHLESVGGEKDFSSILPFTQHICFPCLPCLDEVLHEIHWSLPSGCGQLSRQTTVANHCGKCHDSERKGLQGVKIKGCRRVVGRKG